MDNEDNYVVIEINSGKGYENILGEVLRNNNWIEMNTANKEQKVRGIIISKEITEDLITACLNIPKIELYEYELCIKISRKEVL
jgi:RecB family endonuclease NucS